MTPKDHEMMLLMLTRIYESIGTVVEVLKSREILTTEDVTAFSHAVHFDEQKLLFYIRSSRAEYLACAKLTGVVTGLET